MRTYAHTIKYAHKQSRHACMKACTYTRAHTHSTCLHMNIASMRISEHTHTCTHIHTHIHTHAHERMHARTHARTHAPMHPQKCEPSRMEGGFVWRKLVHKPCEATLCAVQKDYQMRLEIGTSTSPLQIAKGIILAPTSTPKRQIRSISHALTSASKHRHLIWSTRICRQFTFMAPSSFIQIISNVLA